MARKNHFEFLTDQHWFIRFLEAFPGIISWITLILPVILSVLQPILVAYFIIAFDLYWLVKSFRLSIYLIQGYTRMHRSQRYKWANRLEWIEQPEESLAKAQRRLDEMITSHPQSRKLLQFSSEAIRQRSRYLSAKKDVDLIRDIIDHKSTILKPSELYQLVIIATYNEDRDILEPSVQALLDADYPAKQIMLVIAYEERGPATTRALARELMETYGHHFAHAQAIEHPYGIEGEVIGKGGNITYAGRKMAHYLVDQQGMDPQNIIVTTFDADHRPDPQYFSLLSYEYAINPNRDHRSFQPVPMFFNNIWDAPAPMRILATTNSLYMLQDTMRPHMLRNFSAHAQSLKALLETDFWSVITIVEDGHQYWRSFFAFDGDHSVVPIYVPIQQDAVLADTFPKTVEAQYKQQRRWAWGASDFAYAVRQSIRNHRIPLWKKLLELGRLFEGHWSRASAALVVAFVAWLPLFLNQRFRIKTELAHQLPVIASRILTLALVGMVVMIAISMISLPPRPARYKPVRNIFMVLQWVIAPVVTILFGSFAALEAQTRLMFGKYLEFQVTAKSRKK
jgi:cellulose synthase/poly-beta-1,6-N-acetylglucosamine synthase-like glycosyltransferase